MRCGALRQKAPQCSVNAALDRSSYARWLLRLGWGHAKAGKIPAAACFSVKLLPAAVPDLDSRQPLRHKGLGINVLWSALLAHPGRPARLGECSSSTPWRPG